jgi:OCT family organic cation transporter-like MFS transporter 18
MAMSGNLMNTVASSALTKSVPDQDTGTIIGLNMATNSLIRTISPTVGSYLYMWFDYYSFGMLGFILNGAVATLVCLRTPPGTQIRTDLS